MKKMNAKESIEFLRDNGVDITITADHGLVGKSGGGYLCSSDEILYALNLNKETVFHELAHWTGNKSRLDRDMESGALHSGSYDQAANDLEESIAWETTRLMVKRFGGGNWHYYTHALRHTNRNSPEAKWFGRQAFEYICDELKLEK